ncbi:MAG: DNA-binding protein [Candidatus Bathyarchaeota archaeon B26-1]|nr:MAG: DNA-binding protein [Candidatus Bathyarchaeota archaeon B26-1]
MLSVDDELEEIRRRKLLELQRRLLQEQQEAQLRKQAELQKQALLRRILEPKARQRLTNLRMVKPEIVSQLEVQLIQLAQTGRVPIPITDSLLKEILLRIQRSRREIKIRRV